MIDYEVYLTIWNKLWETHPNKILLTKPKSKCVVTILEELRERFKRY